MVWFTCKALLLIALCVPLVAFNLLGASNSLGASEWGKDSQALVLGKIQAQEVGLDDSTWGLLIPVPDMIAPYESLSALQSGSEGFVAYSSQLGAAGHFFSGIYNMPGCGSLDCLRSVSGSITAVSIVALALALATVTRRLLSYTFLAVLATSPWIVAAAPNLYWVPWTWMLPALFAALLVVWSRRPVLRVFAIAGVLVSFMVRFAAGYEFISSITLFAAAFPLISFLIGKRSYIATVARALGLFSAICATAVVAFLLVFLRHAQLRGEGSVLEGIRAIIVGDILRRTYGDPSDFPEVYAASLNADPLSVVMTYIFSWPALMQSSSLGGPVSFDLSGVAFWPLIVISLTIVGLRRLGADPKSSRDIWLIVSTALIPLSWFILGKSHSYIHTPINFFLWYLFFIPVLWFVILDFLKDRSHLFLDRMTLKRQPAVHSA
jgi:hypothetical protein